MCTASRMFVLYLFFVLRSSSIVMGVVPKDEPVHIQQEMDLIPGKLNQVYDLHVVNGTHVSVSYILSNKIINFSTSLLRLEVELRDKSFPPEVCPLLVTVSQGKHVSSFDLPHKPSMNSSIFHLWRKTICVDVERIPKEDPFRGQVQISVVGSTCSTRAVNFRVILRHTPLAFGLRLGNSIPLLVAPTTSEFFKYDWDSQDGVNDVNTVILKLTAPDDRDTCTQKGEGCKCMTASIQSPTCPVYDEVTNMRHSGYWQTFSSSAGITVEKKEFPNGFFIVLVTEFEDRACLNKDGYEARAALEPTDDPRIAGSYYRQPPIPSGLAREKSVALKVQKVLSYSEYVWPTFFPLLVYTVVIILTFVVYVWLHRENVRRYATSNVRPDVQCFLRSEKYIYNTSDDMDGFKREKLERKSFRYLWLLITVAIFYCIPVFQLIINYLGIVYRTGEQDICYYNNLCSLPLNKIMDFNHIYSNIGYCIFGILFILLTKLRQRTTEGRRGFFVFQTQPTCFSLLETIPRRVEYGTFDQYGIFYSLGFSLFMEGLLSASYHICPNKANFQFDTSFMYAMAVLSYVKIYQFRHFLYMNELIAFLLLALVVACTVLGLFSTILAYNILLSVVHLGLVIGFQFFLLFVSRNQESQWEGKPLSKQIWVVFLELVGLQGRARRKNPHLPQLLPTHHPNRSLFFWSVGWNILLVVNSWTLVYGANFATQVFYILLANLGLYVIYYCIMKGIHGEFSGLFSNGIRNPCLGTVFFGGCSFLFWLPGLYYFMNPLSSWEVSPAASREINESCSLLNFYDNHDIWHLLSSPALFFSFMMFLTLDDGLIGRHHESIPVF